MQDINIFEKIREKEEQLIVENVIKQAKVVKMSNSINLDSKYIQAISNANIDITKNLRLISVKKYQKCAGLIKKKVNELYKDQILALATFIKHFQRTHNREKVIEKMKIRREIDFK